MGYILKKNDKLSIFNKGVIFLVTFITIYFTLITSTSLTSKKYSLTPGEIAKFDIRAPRTIVDDTATELRKKQAQENVPQQYSKINDVKNTAVNNIKSLFSILDGLRGIDALEEYRIQKLKTESPIKLSDEDLLSLLLLSEEEALSLENYSVKVVSEIYDNTRIENNVNDIEQAQTTVVTKFTGSNLSSKLKSLGVNIGYTQIKANFFFDDAKTEELRKKAADEVERVIIKKDQIIIKNGEPVTQGQVDLLWKLGLLNEHPKFQWSLYISLGVLVFVVLALQWLYLNRYYKHILNDNNKIILINLLNCVAVILARTVGMISPFLIPFACIPFLLTLLINYKISLVLSVMNIVLIAVSVQFNSEIIILAIVGTALGSIVLRKMQDRNDIIFSTLLVTAASIICTFCIGIILSNDIVEIIKKTGAATLGGIFSGIMTVGLLPFLENTFDVVTILKLLELANPNHPLLKKLLIEAPGTYHHSIMVANLAEVAADEVGANSVLARVGSYYHDVGKIKRPFFFKENQMGMENPHSKIAPNLSALIITSHVKDGLELAKEARVPQNILDIIEQHHGNSLVKYFYITAKNKAEDKDSIKDEDFRYQGQIPISKEAAIVMLADSVEAAVRSICDPSIDKIEIMVNNIFKDKLNDGQLNECQLTFNELEKVKKAFLKALIGMYHQRIEYPEESKRIEDKE